MIEVQKIPILTPMESDHHYLLSLASNYFNVFGALGARVPSPLVFPRDGLLCEKIEIETTSTIIALKVCTMILSLGIFPLIALLVIAIERCREDFLWEVNEAGQIELVPDEPVEVDSFQELFDRRARELAQANENVAAFKRDLEEQAAQKLRKEEERAQQIQQVIDEGRRQTEAQALHLTNALKDINSAIDSMFVVSGAARQL